MPVHLPLLSCPSIRLLNVLDGWGSCVHDCICICICNFIFTFIFIDKYNQLVCECWCQYWNVYKVYRTQNLTNIRCGDDIFIVQHRDLKFVQKKYVAAVFEAKKLRKKSVIRDICYYHNRSVQMVWNRIKPMKNDCFSHFIVYFC